MSDTPNIPVDDIAAQKRALAMKLNRTHSAQGRQKTKRRLNAAVDGRSLRATGRTDQLNFRCSTELKERVKRAAYAHDMAIAELMENALLACLEALEKENP